MIGDTGLRLRPLRTEDEDSVRKAHQVMAAEEFPFALSLDRAADWNDYLRILDFLAHEGGHIGYGVLPQYRRRGHATEMLRQGLVIIRSLGVDRVLVACDEDNTGSATVIETCGGKLDSRVTASDGVLIRRYWID